jgi:hypothetical protein
MVAPRGANAYDHTANHMGERESPQRGRCDPRARPDPLVSATSFTWMKWRPRPPRVESDLRRCLEQPEAVSAGPMLAGRRLRCVAGWRGTDSGCGSTTCAGLTIIIALEAWNLMLRRRDAGAALDTTRACTIARS